MECEFEIFCCKGFWFRVRVLGVWSVKVKCLGVCVRVSVCWVRIKS